MTHVLVLVCVIFWYRPGRGFHDASSEPRFVLTGAVAFGRVVTHPQVVTELMSNSGGHAQNADQVVLRERDGFIPVEVTTTDCFWF